MGPIGVILGAEGFARQSPEHEEGRKAKTAAGCIKENTEPARRFVAGGKEIDPIRIGGK